MYMYIYIERDIDRLSLQAQKGSVHVTQMAERVERGSLMFTIRAPLMYGFCYHFKTYVSNKHNIHQLSFSCTCIYVVSFK